MKCIILTLVQCLLGNFLLCLKPTEINENCSSGSCKLLTSWIAISNPDEVKGVLETRIGLLQEKKIDGLVVHTQLSAGPKALILHHSVAVPM